jgi:hypothetical protein
MNITQFFEVTYHKLLKFVPRLHFFHCNQLSEPSWHYTKILPFYTKNNLLLFLILPKLPLPYNQLFTQ